MQFLPRGLEGEDVVRALLDGDNFHFGNPCLEWQVLIYMHFCWVNNFYITFLLGESFSPIT